MKTTSSFLHLRRMMAVFLAVSLAALAQEPPAAPKSPSPAAAEQAPASPPAAPAAEGGPAAAGDAEKKSEKSEPPLRRLDDPASPATEPASDVEARRVERRTQRRHHGGPEFPFGDHHVPQGGWASVVISIFGSSTVDGDVQHDVVSIFGNTRIGPEAKVRGGAVAVLGTLHTEGEVRQNAVNVLGGLKANNRVDGNVVAVLGDLELGPKAVVGGNIVIVGGKYIKDPNAVVHGNVVNVPVFGGYGDLEWLVTWFKRCFLLGRPLAFGAHLGWAWAIAFSFLAFYLLLALIFPRALEKCVTTFETRPGSSILASILTVFLTPVGIVLLAVTVIGALLVPFVGAGLLCAKLFGKAVILAWLGRRFTRFFGNGPLGHPVFAVLVGGIIVMLLYTVPIFGFVLYKLLTWLGLGVAVYTLSLAMKREKAPPAKPVPGGVVAGAPATATAGVVAGASVPVTPRPDFTPPPAPTEARATHFSAGETPPAMTMAATSGAATSSAAQTSETSSTAQATQAMPPPVDVPPVTSVPPFVHPEISAATLPRAGFMIRSGALLLDVVLVGLLLAFTNALLPRSFHPEPPAILPLLAIYGAVMWKIRGTTIGGIVCGLKVVRVDNRAIDWPTAIVRALSCFLSLAVAGLGFIWVAIDSDKQSWHDKIAGTTVVRMPKGVSLL